MKRLYAAKDIVGKIITISKSYILLCFFSALCKSLVPVILLVLPAKIIDELTGGVNLPNVFLLVLGCTILPAVLNGINELLGSRIAVKARKVEDGLDQSVNEVLLNVDYEKLENPDIMKNIQKLQDGRNMVGTLTGVIQSQVLLMLSSIVQIFLLIPILIQLLETDYMTLDSAYLDSAPFFVKAIATNAGLCLAFILILGIVSIFIKYHTEIRKRNIVKGFSDVERAYGYYTGLIADYENGADVRLNELFSLLNSKRLDYKANERKMYKMLGGIESLWGSIGIFIKRVVEIMPYVVITCKILCGTISVGGLYLYINTIAQLIGCINGIFYPFSEFQTALGYYEAYPYLWNMVKSENGKGSDRSNTVNQEGVIIEFQNVSFRYPGSQRWIVRNIDLKINYNEKIAIVGPNGAGKSTLVKLIMGFYEPQEGHIYINGKEIRNFDKNELYDLYGVVFQDNHFLASEVGNNVSCGKKYDMEKMQETMQAVGLGGFLKERGMNAQFSKHLHQDGIIFSGGEEQKLAIARMIYKKAPILIMDEPTASLDPISENEINNMMMEFSQNHTSIIISHRLSSCCRCDRIVVLRKGKIIEEGSHDKLLQKESLYALMWKLQARNYVEM